jgi:hypothetical protein
MLEYMPACYDDARSVNAKARSDNLIRAIRKSLGVIFHDCYRSLLDGFVDFAEWLHVAFRSVV